MFSSDRSGDFLLSTATNQHTPINNNNNNNNIDNNISADGEFLTSRELNGSDVMQNQGDRQSSELARYRSAPSSFLAVLLDSDTDNNNNDNNSSSGDESEVYLSALIDGPLDLNRTNGARYSMKHEIGHETEPRPGLFRDGQMAGYVGSYCVGMESQVHVSSSSNGDGNKNCSNLVRQTSSPAGFFNGFSVMREVGNYSVRNHTETSSSAGGFSNHHINFSSAPSSSSRFMPTIPENVNESIPTSSPKNVRWGDGNSSWNEPPSKRNRDGDLKMFSNFSGLEYQNGESRKKSIGLVSHMSLPRTCGEMATIEKYLHFQQETAVPCQIRAKRGFATHPRSIAERMRRTRISDNMKKLQDLFPNIDKQTNTADMLDLAVGYIKDLQGQVQRLTDTRAKCVCSSKPQQTSPTT